MTSASHAEGPEFDPRSSYSVDTLAEWLRRQPAKLVGSAREGSNPSGVVIFTLRFVRLVMITKVGIQWRPSGAMDSAFDFESKGCRFESCLGCSFGGNLY